MSEEKATEVQVEETAAEDITTDSDGASEPALSLAASAAAPTAPAYSPVAWKNGKENGTKANADNFNHMDSQIEQLTSVINAQAALIDTLQTNIAALQESVNRISIGQDVTSFEIYYNHGMKAMVLLAITAQKEYNIVLYDSGKLTAIVTDK